MIDMKKLLLYLGVLILCTGSASPVIVYSPAATAAEKTAVRELAEHLKKISGTPVRCVKEGEKFVSSRPVYVGHTRFAASKIDLKNFGPEESLIQSSGKSLIITGGRPRGTLYGVYEFLERVGKVVWIDEKNTFIPVDPQLKWDNLNIRTRPFFRYRGIYTIPTWCGNKEERLRFLSRSRENIFWEFRLTPEERKRYGIAPVLGRPAPLNTMHYYSSLWPVKGMENAHSLNVNGKRDYSKSFAGPGQLCFSSLLARKKVTEQMAQFIEQDRKEFAELAPVIYNLSINDTHDRCECKDCVAKAKKYNSYAGTVLEFVNAVADGIAKKYPEIKIQTSAYLFTEKTPSGIVPRKNVVVRLSPSPWGSKCQTMVPLNDPVNKKTLTDMKKWSRIAKIHVWNYWVLFGNFAGKNAGVTGIDAMTANLRIFKELGSDYVFSECEFPDTASFHALRIYLGYQLLKNPDQDKDALIDRYFKVSFGQAAPAMRKFYDYQQKRQASAAPKDYRDAALRPWIDKAYFDFAEKCLNEAEKAAEKDAAILGRIRQERVPVDIARVSVRSLKSDSAVEKRLKKNWKESINRYYGKNIPKPIQAVYDKLFKTLEKPEQGSKYPLPEALKKRVRYDITWQNFSSVSELSSFGLRLVDDKEAAGGKAMRLAVPLRTAVKNFHKKALQIGIYSRSAKKALATVTLSVKSEEKYHFYKIAQVKLEPVTLLYIHSSWYIQQHLDRYFTAGENNVYEIWISLKAQGKAYCKNSVRENSLSVDRILLLEPEKK